MMLADNLHCHCGGGTEEFHQKPSPWPDLVLLYSVVQCSGVYSTVTTSQSCVTSQQQQNRTWQCSVMRSYVTLQQSAWQFLCRVMISFPPSNHASVGRNVGYCEVCHGCLEVTVTRNIVSSGMFLSHKYLILIYNIIRAVNGPSGNFTMTGVGHY